MTHPCWCLMVLVALKHSRGPRRNTLISSLQNWAGHLVCGSSWLIASLLLARRQQAGTIALVARVSEQ